MSPQTVSDPIPVPTTFNRVAALLYNASMVALAIIGATALLRSPNGLAALSVGALIAILVLLALVRLMIVRVGRDGSMMKRQLLIAALFTLPLLVFLMVPGVSPLFEAYGVVLSQESLALTIVPLVLWVGLGHVPAYRKWALNRLGLSR